MIAHRYLNTQSTIAVAPNKELSKPFHIQLLRILYQAATDLSYYSLDYDDQALSWDQVLRFILKHQLIQPRNQKFKKCIKYYYFIRSWGDVIASFIRYKWECIESIILYANAVSLPRRMIACIKVSIGPKEQCHKGML